MGPPAAAIRMFLFTTPKQRAAALPATPFAEPMQAAAKATGVSFDYLTKTAERESRFDPKAKAPTSTATGLFQFLEQTWLGMLKQEGPKFGLNNEAAAIQGADGRFQVADGATKQRLLALREDPAVSSMMAGAFAARNGARLKEALGRNPTEGELYVAHFLGAGGARELIQLAQTSPDTKAAGAFPDAAAANRSIFFDRSGRARSAMEVYQGLTASFAATSGTTAPTETAATRDAAHAMFRVKGEGKPIHGLFRSDGQAVASPVSEAWARMGRRNLFADAEPQRVAFYPSAAGRATVSDAAAAAPVRGRPVTVALPPERPQPLARGADPVVPTTSARTKKNVVQEQRPLDLMRFLKPGVRS